eukprot:CAMPEP_0170177616 /NCGR_PEP_ID=MMETSP0040_2-20121228/10610_1 /TAXON_ID=641309 /ORGANISM="Lotharella oceanica, Strain CCMP622" /LENGTH=159 /DNA_ID=CAMNT_0010420307 /DNA_START=27 /DNA_END=506 /DNA_ORIENTATION=-
MTTRRPLLGALAAAFLVFAALWRDAPGYRPVSEDSGGNSLQYGLFEEMEAYEDEAKRLYKKVEFECRKHKAAMRNLRLRLNHSGPYLKAVPLEADNSIQDPYVQGLADELCLLRKEAEEARTSMNAAAQKHSIFVLTNKPNGTSERLPWPRPKQKAMFD